jgi:hypothetical protein
MPAPQWCGQVEQGGVEICHYSLPIQPGVQPVLIVVRESRNRKTEQLILTVLDSESWTNSPARSLWGPLSEMQALKTAVASFRQQLRLQKCALAFFAPRDVEPTPWLGDPKEAIHVRRRYMLLGQTVDSMRVWDIRCAAHALKELPGLKKSSLLVRSRGEMGVNTAYAALFEPSIAQLELEGTPSSHEQGPDYLNVLKVWDIPALMETLGRRVNRTR